MRTVTLEELLEAGSHFGHQVTRHNPKSRDYVFEARDNIHIIDLAKTKEGLEDAARYVKSVAEKGGSMVILGAKRQADVIVKEEAKRAKGSGGDELYFVTARWIGGLLTNLPEVSKNFRKLQDLTERLNNPFEKAKFTKKEISLWEKERQKLENFYSGVMEMKKLPDLVFIIDTHLEDLAVREARAMGVKTVGITDTNADPTLIDYPIPANDDAAGSIKLITSYIVDAWIEGKTKRATSEGNSAKSGEQRAESKTNAEKKAESKEAQATTVVEKAKKSGDKKSATAKATADKEEKIVDESLNIDPKQETEPKMEQAVHQKNMTKKNDAKVKTTVKK